MTDYFHWKFDKVNNYLHENPKLVKYLITLSSLIYDLFIPIAIGIWMFLDRNRRFSIAFGLIHVLRLICIYVHLMKVPDKIIWNDPGILPSLTVSYSIPTVFFYNGQIAILALSIYYLFSLKDCKFIYPYIYIYIYRETKNSYLCILSITDFPNGSNAMSQNKLFNRLVTLKKK